ncbi:MAG: hypothetical protein MI724_07235 [Spirochaetales bacterium]|nr:hypothetical protein [Spirochaetales bacterium]
MALLSFVLLFTAPVAGETPETTTHVLQDGTTIIETHDEAGRLIREEVVLRNGRHKTTYFDAGGEPRYSVVTTGTGSFGIMYYDEAEAPLFKFWHHGGGERIIQFHSHTFEPIGSVMIETDGTDRRVVWSREGIDRGARTVPILVSFLAGAACTALFAYAAVRRASKSRRD